MTESPEGFLICHNVPLARTGTQDYLSSEVTGEYSGDIVKVYRLDEDVFANSTLASFEGKPVTDNHPPEFVLPSNATGYARGSCSNVRRGTGDESHMIVADLVIYDANLIGEIQAGKREISAGYTCNYVEYKDGYKQTNIVCNHIAVVDNGRAGPQVRIKDSDTVKRKETTMSKSKNKVWEFLKHLAKDEATTPEEFKEAAETLAKDDDEVIAKESKDEATEEEVAKVVQDAISPLVRKIAELERMVLDAEPDKEEKEDVLDAFEEELTKDEDGEESAVIDPNKINDEDATEESEEVIDRATALRIFKTLKPTLDSLPQSQKVMAVSSLRRELLGKSKRKASNANEYAAMFKRQVSDSKSSIVSKYNEFGEACRARNPHFKGGK